MTKKTDLAVGLGVGLGGFFILIVTIIIILLLYCRSKKTIIKDISSSKNDIMRTKKNKFNKKDRKSKTSVISMEGDPYLSSNTTDIEDFSFESNKNSYNYSNQKLNENHIHNEKNKLSNKQIITDKKQNLKINQGTFNEIKWKSAVDEMFDEALAGNTVKFNDKDIDNYNNNYNKNIMNENLNINTNNINKNKDLNKPNNEIKNKNIDNNNDNENSNNNNNNNRKSGLESGNSKDEADKMVLAVDNLFNSALSFHEIDYSTIRSGRESIFPAT